MNFADRFNHTDKINTEDDLMKAFAEMLSELLEKDPSVKKVLDNLVRTRMLELLVGSFEEDTESIKLLDYQFEAMQEMFIAGLFKDYPELEVHYYYKGKEIVEEEKE